MGNPIQVKIYSADTYPALAHAINIDLKNAVMTEIIDIKYAIKGGSDRVGDRAEYSAMVIFR